MTETCRLRRGEGYGACDDEVVSKCALREKREASRLPGTLQNHRTGLNSSHKKSSNCSKLIPVTFGNAFSKIAPS